jgi:hypothetical protein
VKKPRVTTLVRVVTNGSTNTYDLAWSELCFEEREGLVGAREGVTVSSAFG